MKKVDSEGKNTNYDNSEHENMESTYSLVSLEQKIRTLEIEHIKKALNKCGGDINNAADSLGISSDDLQDKMKKLGMH